MIDFRSDTVTRPTPEMKEAMFSAPLGDDVLGDDPTVAELERIAAEKTGKEAAVFVPSGTMGNQIAVASHTHPGEAMIIEEEAHILYYELAGSAMHSGIVNWTLPSVYGGPEPDLVKKRITKASDHTPATTLLCLESSHNRKGGTVIPLEYMAAYRKIADSTGMKIHLDGARVFNAAVSLGVDVREITGHVDSVNFCLSKGLRCPVGSVLCGSHELIERARKWRKRLGGGMRQAGILAAAGIYALNHNIERLQIDHDHAKRLAKALSLIPGLSVDLDRVQTNLILIHSEGPAKELVSRFESIGVACFDTGPNTVRWVIHGDVTAEQVETVMERLSPWKS